MDDIREQMDLANEVASAISQPVGFGYDFDEASKEACSTKPNITYMLVPE